MKTLNDSGMQDDNDKMVEKKLQTARPATTGPARHSAAQHLSLNLKELISSNYDESGRFLSGAFSPMAATYNELSRVWQKGGLSASVASTNLHKETQQHLQQQLFVRWHQEQHQYATRAAQYFQEQQEYTARVAQWHLQQTYPQHRYQDNDYPGQPGAMPYARTSLTRRV